MTDDKPIEIVPLTEDVSADSDLPKNGGEPVNEQPAGPPIVAQITLGFLVDGGIEVNFINAKAPHMWAGAKLLDTIATRMWNDSRDQQVAMHVQQQAEIVAAQRAIEEMKRKAKH